MASRECSRIKVEEEEMVPRSRQGWKSFPIFRNRDFNENNLLEAQHYKQNVNYNNSFVGNVWLAKNVWRIGNMWRIGNVWRTGNDELTCDESDCQVEHNDVGGGRADRDAKGGEDRTDDGDHTTAVPVDHGASDRAHAQRHAH